MNKSNRNKVRDIKNKQLTVREEEVGYIGKQMK